MESDWDLNSNDRLLMIIENIVRRQRQLNDFSMSADKVSIDHDEQEIN